MFWKMLKGALIRRRDKQLMIAVTIALGVCLATAMLSVMFDVGDKVNQELKNYGANLTVTPRGASILGEMYDLESQGQAAGEAENSGQYLAEKDVPKIKMIFWAYNIVGLAPYLETRVKSGAEDFTLVGSWFDRRLVLPTGDEAEVGLTALKPWWDIIGQKADDNDLTGALLGRDLADRLGLEPGGQFTVTTASGEQRKLTVRGIIYGGGSEDDQAFVPLKLVQDVSHRPGLVSKIEVSALTTPENDLARRAAQDPNSLSPTEKDTWYCTAYISSIAYQIEEIIPGARARALLRVAESEGSILTKTQLLMALLTLLALICSALAISNLVTAGVMERSAEIGLLKALGATDLAISVLILTEILITALTGGLAGYFLGLGFARIIGQTVFGAPVALKILVIPLAALIVLAVTLAGCLPAVRLLSRLRPTEVLHGK